MVATPTHAPSKPYPWWPWLGAIAGTIAFSFLAAVFVGLLLDIAEALRVVPLGTFTSGFKRQSSVISQCFGGLLYLFAIAFLAWALPRVAKMSLPRLGFWAGGLLRWKQLLAALGVAIGIKAAEISYVTGFHQEGHKQNGFESFEPHGAAELWAAGIVLVVITPIAEELFFRALIFRGIAQRLSVPWSVAISGAIFGALHGDLIYFPILMLLGVSCAIVYARTGNLWAAITVHAANNGVAFVALVFESLATKHH